MTQPAHFNITELADRNIDRIVSDIILHLASIGQEVTRDEVRKTVLINTSIHTAVAAEIDRIRHEGHRGGPSPLRTASDPKPRIITG